MPLPLVAPNRAPQRANHASQGRVWEAVNMPHFASVLVLSLLLCLAAGCDDDSGTAPDGATASDAARPVDGGVAVRDAAPTDAGPVDAGPVDAGPADAGPVDAGPTDAGPMDAGSMDGGPLDGGPPDAGPADAGPRCDLRPPPPGTTEVFDTDGSRFRYEGFGMSMSTTNRYGLFPDEYIAIEVQAPDVEDLMWKLSFEMPMPTYTTPTAQTISLSECPGDFSTTGRCLTSGLTTNLPYSTDPGVNPLLACPIERGRRYYVNVIHARADALTESACSPAVPTRPCGVLFTDGL